MKIKISDLRRIIKEEVEITDDGRYIERLPEGELARPLDPQFLQNEKRLILPQIDQKIKGIVMLVKQMQDVRKKISTTNDINEFEEIIKSALMGRFPNLYKNWFDKYELRVKQYNKK